MKKIIILISLIIIIILIIMYLNKNTIKYIKVATTKENKINEVNNETKIKIYFPNTNYKVLNKEIKKVIYNNLSEFKTSLKEQNNLPYQYYTLFITYDEYKYQEYISIVFYIETFIGGAHPSHDIKTINYNIDKNKIITIEDIYEQDKNILNKLSIYSREKLLKEEKYSDNNIKSMLLEGTKPTLDNFKNFSYTEDGFKIYFNYYQIAPYYYGSSVITVPYNYISK